MLHTKSRILLASICFLMVYGRLFAQPEIGGTLNLDSTWNRVIYLSLIPGLDQLNTMSNKMIIDRTEIDENGNFAFNTHYLPAKYNLYRLHISKKGDPPASLIIGGKSENHIFLIANKQSEVIITNSDSECIFGNLEINNSPRNQQLNEVNKMVLFLDTANFSGSSLKREFLEDAFDEKLRQFADTCSYSLVALYAIYKSNFESDIKTNPDFYIRFLKKWKNEKSPYFEEFRKRIPVKAGRDFAYLYGFIGILLGIVLMYAFGKRKKTDSSNPVHQLTVQERNIFIQLQQGKSNKEISEELNISLSTVKSHVNSIFSKLNIKSRKEVLNI